MPGRTPEYWPPSTPVKSRSAVGQGVAEAVLVLVALVPVVGAGVALHACPAAHEMRGAASAADRKVKLEIEWRAAEPPVAAVNPIIAWLAPNNAWIVFGSCVSLANERCAFTRATLSVVGGE